MEDQQPAAGDLTVDAALATDKTEADETAEAAEVEAPDEADKEATATTKKGRRIWNRRSGGKRITAVATDVTEDAQAADVDTAQSEPPASDESADAVTESAEPVAEETEAAEAVTEETEAAEAVTEETEADAADEVDGEEEAQDEGKDEAAETPEAEILENKTAKTKRAKNKPTKRARRKPTKPLIGKRTAVAIVVAASLLFVGSAVYAGATTQRYLSERAVIAIKLNVARTAANAITTLWSYTPENMDTLADRAATYLSGDFAAQYRKFVDAIVAPNKQAKISSNTLVTGAAVETLDGPTAIAIVYTNTSSTSALKKNIPSLKYLSYRVNLKRDHGRWLVTRMTTVTQLDITPHL